MLFGALTSRFSYKCVTYRHIRPCLIPLLCIRGLLPALPGPAWLRSAALQHCPGREAGLPAHARIGPARREAHHPLGVGRIQPATDRVAQLASPAPALLRNAPPFPIPRHRRRQQGFGPPATPAHAGAGRRHGQHPPPAASRRNPQTPGHAGPGPPRGLAGQGRSQPPPSVVGTRRPGAPCGTTAPCVHPRCRRHGRPG
jgi:hypothetical protein